MNAPPRRHGDPYRNLAWMRSTMPVAEVPSPDVRTWLVTSYELARTLLTDDRLSNDAGTGGLQSSGASLLGTDAPTHPRLRKLVAGFFTPRVIERLRADIGVTVAQTVDGFASLGKAELARELALPVPVTVIHDILGVPASARAAPAEVMSMFYRVGFLPDPAGIATGEVDRYVHDLISDTVAAHRTDGSSGIIGDLTSRVDMGEVSSHERASLVYTLLGAGHTTTVPFLAGMILRLLEDPSRRPTGPSSIRNVVDEALRYDSAVQATVNRYAREPMTAAGVNIAPGDRIIISLAGANRDPDRFADPDEFRSDGAGRPSNLAFGHGPHACLGPHLARLEAEVVIGVLFDRLQDVRLVDPPGATVWTWGPMLRGPATVSVEFTPEAEGQRDEESE